MRDSLNGMMPLIDLLPAQRNKFEIRCAVHQLCCWFSPQGGSGKRIAPKARGAVTSVADSFKLEG